MTSTGRGRILGRVSEVDGVPTVHLEDVYDTDIADLWAAITEPERLGRWIAQVEGELRPGGRFTASFTSGWAGTGRVDLCEEPHHLLVTLEPGSPDETQVEAVLTQETAGVRLVVEERGLAADEAPDHGAGWQAHLEDLRDVLEGRETGSWSDRWSELRSAYGPMPS